MLCLSMCSFELSGLSYIFVCVAVTQSWYSPAERKKRIPSWPLADHRAKGLVMGPVPQLAPGRPIV